MMHTNHQSRRQGLIATFVAILVAIIIASMLGFDLRKIIESDLVQKNFIYLRDLAAWVWNGIGTLGESIRSPFAK